jgi:hypothetical protein
MPIVEGVLRSWEGQPQKGKKKKRGTRRGRKWQERKSGFET